MEIDYLSPVTPERLTEFVRALSHRGVSVGSIGESILGREIPLITLGRGKKAVILVGSHHGAESITTLILMRFAEELSEKRRLRGFDIPHILLHRRIYIVPMLNPDGVAIQGGGAETAGALCGRVREINGSDDFSLWQANARGVDLNHNYDAEFQKCKQAEEALGILAPSKTRYGGPFPESEPETKALATLTRYLSAELSLCMALHTQGEEIYYDFEGETPRDGRMLAELFAKRSGYTAAHPPKEASYGGYKDFVIREFQIPAFTVECGKGKNPLPPSDLPRIYERVLPILLTACAYENKNPP